MNTKNCARMLVVSLLFQFAIVPAGVFAVPADTAVTLTASTPSGTSDTVPTSETAMPAVVPSNQNADSASGSVAATAGSSQSPAPVTESTVPATPTPVVSAAPAVETTPEPSATAQTAPSVALDAGTPSAPLPTTPTAPVVDAVTPTAEKTVTAPAVTVMAAAALEVTNLIQNPSLETANGSLPANWSQEKYGTHSAVFTYPVAGHTGEKAAQITMVSYSSGDAKWVFDSVAVMAGAEYVFSDWYQSTAKSLVVAQYTTSTGTTQYVQLGSLTASTTWKQFSKTFTIPSGVAKMTVLHLIKANGSLAVDDYSLTSSTSVPTPAPTLTLAANPVSIVSGSSSTLTWSTTDATTCSATGGWTSSTATSGTASVTPSATTTYSMTCTGAGGTATKTATVTVTTPNPAPTLALAANPASIVSGSSSTLTWSSTDATSCAANWTSSTATSGTATVTPAATTTYSMTCTGAGGTATKAATVTVTTVPVPTQNLILNPSLETANGSLPANWAKSNWGTLTATYAYPVAGHTGDKAAQITVSGYKNGDAKWYFDDVAVTPGAEYVFTDWSKSAVPSTVIARFKTSAGALQYVEFGTVTGTGAWTQYSKSFTVPAGIVSMTILHVIKANGALAIDDASLTRNEAVFSEGMVSFTFDDGFLNTYAAGLPILDAAGIKSTQAIITGSLGTTNYVSAAQVQDMAARGHEIASHTRTHADLPTLSAATLESEVAGSRADLAAIGVTANTIVYPYGTYNDSVIAAVQSAGYTGARSVDDGYNTPMTGKYVVRDQHITSDVTFDAVKTWVDTAIANRQWLVLELHQQSATGGTYSNDPALLQRIVDYVKQQNLKTVTLGQGAAMLQ